MHFLGTIYVSIISSLKIVSLCLDVVLLTSIGNCSFHNLYMTVVEIHVFDLLAWLTNETNLVPKTNTFNKYLMIFQDWFSDLKLLYLPLSTPNLDMDIARSLFFGKTKRFISPVVLLKLTGKLVVYLEVQLR